MKPKSRLSPQDERRLRAQVKRAEEALQSYDAQARYHVSLKPWVTKPAAYYEGVRQRSMALLQGGGERTPTTYDRALALVASVSKGLKPIVSPDPQSKVAKPYTFDQMIAQAQASTPPVTDRSKLLPGDFVGMPFTMNQFLRGLNAGVSVEGKDGRPIPLGKAMADLSRATGMQSFEFTKSQSQVEEEFENEIALEMARRAQNSDLGRSIEAWRSGDPQQALATTQLGVIRNGIGRTMAGLGYGFDLLDSGNFQNALAHATTSQGLPLSPAQRDTFAAKYAGNALSAISLGAGAVGEVPLAEALDQWASRFGNGMGYADKAAVLADATQPQDERSKARDGLAWDLVVNHQPAVSQGVERAIGKIRARNGSLPSGSAPHPRPPVPVQKAEPTPAPTGSGASPKWLDEPGARLSAKDPVRLYPEPAVPALGPLVRNDAESQALARLKKAYGDAEGTRRFAEIRRTGTTDLDLLTGNQVPDSILTHAQTRLKALQSRRAKLGSAEKSSPTAQALDREITDLAGWLTNAQAKGRAPRLAKPGAPASPRRPLVGPTGRPASGAPPLVQLDAQGRRIDSAQP